MSSRTQPFHDNVVILTGASMGIGEQLAYRLADQGAHVVLAARSERRLQQVAAACAARAGTAGYNASKHALRGFLNTVRAELAGTGVTVSVAYAGAVRTARLAETMGPNVNKVRAMAPERCAEIVLDVATRRKRQTVMTIEGRLLVTLAQVVPGLVDRLLARIPTYDSGG